MEKVGEDRRKLEKVRESLRKSEKKCEHVWEVVGDRDVGLDATTPTDVQESERRR